MDFTTKELQDVLLECVQDALLDNLTEKSDVINKTLNAKLTAAQNWLWDMQEESE